LNLIKLNFIYLFIFFQNSAEWEARKQSLDSKTPSQMRKEVDMEGIHQVETHTPYSRTVTAAAQVESSQMMKLDDHHRPSLPMNSNHSVSPVATTPLRNIINNVPEADRAHVLHDDRNLVNSGESLYLFVIISYLHTFRASLLFLRENYVTNF
jgi:hypothetical protein